MFKIFPGTYTSDGRKVPIAEMKGWYENQLASSDQHQVAEWNKLYSHKIKLWMVPTGVQNGLLVLDVDVKDGVDGFKTIKERNYHLPQTMSQRTRSGGLHYIYRYPMDGRRYGNRTKFDTGLDVRGEGGYIAYYGTDSTPIAEAPQWLMEEALKAEVKSIAELDPSQLVKISWPIVQEILNSACENIRQAPEGESNNVLNVESYRVGQLIPSGSLDRDTAYSTLFKAAKDRGKPDYEAKATINSGLDGGGKTPYINPFGNEMPVLTIPEAPQVITDRWTPTFFTKYDLTNMSKLRKPQLFKDWSTEDISITTADGGTGKTTLKLVEAISLALGESFLGFECSSPGRTLFITGEDTKEKIGAMLGAILKQMGLLDGTPENDAKVRKVMDSILVKKDTDLCLITKSKDGFINHNMEALKKVMEAVEDIRPKMIVFDPIASFWGSEAALNDMSKAVAKFLGHLVEKSNACVEVINHMGKQSSNNKDMSQFAGRGGTGLPSHSRVSRVLRPVYDEEFSELTGMELGDRGAIMCNVNKFSDGSPLYNKPFLIVRNGYLFERVTLVESKIKEEQEKMGDNERIFTYIAEERGQGRYPSKGVIQAHFSMRGEKISKDRVAKSLEFLGYMGHLGEKIKAIENPDVEVGGKVYVITDMSGKEL
jgi:RecA-family ATPase